MSQVGFQLRLQRELFDPCGEQLLSLVRCLLTSSTVSSDHGGKKSKAVYLTLCNSPTSQSTQQQGIFHISLYELKSSVGAAAASSATTASNVEELPKKKRNWNLRQVKALDGKYDAEAAANGIPNLEFSLTFASDDEYKSNAAQQQ
jgi:hypothetical protein